MARVLDKFPDFSGQLIVRPLADGDSWVLMDDLAYKANDGRSIVAPRGFITDFASVPQFLWWWTAPWGRHGFAGIVHDWLYYIQDVSRADADALFREIMGKLGVRPTKAWLMWVAVRGPGFFAWQANSRRTERKGPGWKQVDLDQPEPEGRFSLTRRAGRKVE